MRKPIAKTQGDQTPLARNDELGLKDLPALRKFFLETSYEDGDGKREPGVMIIRAFEDAWSFTLKEPSQCLQLRIQTRTWEDGLLAVEIALEDPSKAWDTDSWAVKSKGKKK